MKKSLIIAVLAAVATFSLSSCYFLPDEEELLAPPTVKANEVNYTTSTVKKKDLIKQVINSGHVVSTTEVEESFDELGGNLKSIYVKAGDKVTRGELIAEFDTYDLDYRIITQRLQVEKATLNHKIAIEKELSQAEIDSAKVDIQLRQNELDQLLEEQSEAKLYASMTGTVSYVADLQTGSYVNAGTVLVKLIDDADLEIKLTPSDVTIYEKNQDVIIKIGDKTYDGKVSYTPKEAEEDENTDELKNVTVTFQASVADMSGMVGNLADVTLIQQRADDVVVVSNSVIKTVNDKKVVYVLENDTKVEREVEIGLQTTSESEIKSGLQAGDLIILR